TKVVAVAERHGRAVKLLVVPGTNPLDAIARTAARLQAHEIVLGASAKMTADAQAIEIGEVWDRVSAKADSLTHLVVVQGAGSVRRFALGAHTPNLTTEDVERIHLLWVEAVRLVGPKVHHR